MGGKIVTKYVSFETALSYHSILNYNTKITKYASLKKNGKFSHVFPSNLFFGFVERDDLVIAEPEKALLDLLYFNPEVDLSDIDWERLSKKKMDSFASRMNFNYEPIMSKFKESLSKMNHPKYKMVLEDVVEFESE